MFIGGLSLLGFIARRKKKLEKAAVVRHSPKAAALAARFHPLRAVDQIPTRQQCKYRCSNIAISD
jgi:hypothetical protein